MELTLALSLSLLLLTCTTTTTSNAHNITKILAKHPEFSTFSHYLTTTHLASVINSRETITVCAVDNAGMSSLLSKGLSVYALKNVLSFHVLLDYFGAKKLHQIRDGSALAATMFQATGTAAGSSGFVNITDLKGGKVGFGAKDNGGKPNAFFVKSLEEIPYNISVIQISTILSSPEAEAPTPGPSAVNLTTLMSAHGCKVFAESLLGSPAEKTFEDAIDGGLTVFCPGDDAFKGFLPKFKNLSAAGKQAIFEFHGVPIYQSMQMLKSNNGMMNTLATDGANYQFTVQNDGELVTLKTKLVTAKIVGTLFDEQPLAIYTIDKVLMPKELFKGGLAPTPAPAPAPDADAEAPKAPSKKKKKHLSPPEPDSPSDSPADAPDEDSEDQVADANGAVKFDGSKLFAVALCLCLVFLQM